MKRIISLMLVVLMVFLLTCCKDKDVNNYSSDITDFKEDTVISTPSETDEEDSTENMDAEKEEEELSSSEEVSSEDEDNIQVSSPTKPTKPVSPTHEHEYVGKVTKNETCTNKGVKTFTCSCGSYYTEATPALDHNWGEWTITKEPTASSEGNSQRECITCGETENNSIAKLPESTTVVVTEEHLRRIEEGFLRLINDERKILGIQPLTKNSHLDTVAQTRSVEIIEVFDHYRPDGKFFTTIVDESAYPYYALSENIVNVSHLGDGSRVQEDPWTGSDEQIELAYSWMFYAFKNSPAHYENIKNPTFNETGVGISYVIDEEKSIPYFYLAHIFGVQK